jgi:L-alanine-DL-glutamate epimerase-like enolase superfamily enzyme
MKIRSLRATPVNIPLTAPYRFSYGSTASLTKTVIEVETEDGVTGLGECADGDRARDVMAVAPRIKGQDIRALTTIQNLIVPGMAYTPWGNPQAGPQRNSPHRIFQLPPAPRRSHPAGNRPLLRPDDRRPRRPHL